MRSPRRLFAISLMVACLGVGLLSPTPKATTQVAQSATQVGDATPPTGATGPAGPMDEVFPANPVGYVWIFLIVIANVTIVVRVGVSFSAPPGAGSDRTANTDRRTAK